ncbi:MAG: putative sulfate exporter family transporter, partial [Candidatus Acidiferrum sp.]
MTTSVAIEQPKSNSLSSCVFSFIPGVILLAAIGYSGKFIEQSVSRYGKSHHLSLPNIEYVLWAILIGLAISNTVRIPELFKAGIATYEFWLK